MKKYFERIMYCNCGESQRQTATTLPLDWIGNAIASEQRKDFLNSDLGKKHLKCNKVNYTPWKLAKICAKDYEVNS